MNNTQEKWFERLREMAEQAVKNQSVDVKNIDSADITKLINDIQVFQAELEIQTDVNDAYCKMTGYPKDQMLGMSIGDLDAIESPEVTAARI